MKAIRLLFELPGREGLFKRMTIDNTSNYYLKATEMSLPTNLYLQCMKEYSGTEDDMKDSKVIEHIFRVRFRIFEFDKNGVVIEKSIDYPKEFLYEILLFRLDELHYDLIIHQD